MNTCRVCGNKFYSQPLLRYEQMPKSAQFLPDAVTLKLDQGITLDICQCTGCGLVQHNSEPVHYYKEVIRAASFSATMRAFRKQQFETFIEKNLLTGKKVIEIGCGRGDYLSILNQLPVKAFGLEYAESSVAYCVRNGMQVRKGFVEDSSFRIPEMPFDAFFIMNFLEHLPDPNAVLLGIRSNLSVGGMGIIEVPNFDMIVRKNIFSEFITDHLFYFTRDTLSTLLNLNGFDVVECTEIWQEYIISAVVRSRGKTDLSNFTVLQSRIEKQIKEFVAAYGEKRVGIWGAGHQAFAVMALAGLTGKIKYVIDSAPFKQNKYTPATHIPIVAPDRLAEDPVDAIIVMAGGYSDEVAIIVRQSYEQKMDIAILRDFGLETV